MYTVAALTHDMGYPLQKLAKLNKVVGDLLQSFGGVDWQHLKVSLSLPQHAFAQDVLRLLSSHARFRIADNTILNEHEVTREVQKLWEDYKSCKTIRDYKDKHQALTWAVRLRMQWKYHQKYAGSLEENQHGFLSALLLQRKLLYFREGEFALEEDYPFKLEEARQFIIRRDILRAVTSHTCADIYFLSTLSTEPLLFFCDEIQDWGRPYFRDLYSLNVSLGAPEVKLIRFDKGGISWTSSWKDLDVSAFAWKILSTVRSLYKRLRSAPETEGRQFGLEWKGTIANRNLEAWFRFDDAKKNFVCRVTNTATKSTEDVLALFNELFAGSDSEHVHGKLKGIVDKLAPAP